jgi:hypothetical protein
MSLARIVVREDPFDMAFAFVLGLVALLQRLVFMWPKRKRKRERGKETKKKKDSFKKNFPARYTTQQLGPKDEEGTTIHMIKSAQAQ